MLPFACGSNAFQPTLPARGATIRDGAVRVSKYISTHAPRTGSDTRRSRKSSARKRFQPTLPARGATAGDTMTGPLKIISTHAPRTGSDSKTARF